MLDELFSPLEGEGDVPLYAQLQTRLRRALTSGDLGIGDALPTERSAADQLAISRVTVRKAYDGLVSEGLLYRRQGAGTFVSERIEKPFTQITSFTEDIQARGQTPTSRWISQTVRPATAEETMDFGLHPGASIVSLERVRYADNQPLAFELSTIPRAALPEKEPLQGSLYQAMAKVNARPVRALQRLRAVCFPPDIEQQLGVPEGAAGLYIERRGYTAQGRVCEFTRSFYRGDAYDFVAELHVGSRPATADLR